jgi:hypothetical protein
MSSHYNTSMGERNLLRIGRSSLPDEKKIDRTQRKWDAMSDYGHLSALMCLTLIFLRYTSLSFKSMMDKSE